MAQVGRAAVKDGEKGEEDGDGEDAPGDAKVGDGLDQAHNIRSDLVTARESTRVDSDEPEVEELIDHGRPQGEATRGGFRGLACGSHDRQVVDQRRQHEIEEQRRRLHRQDARQPSKGDRNPPKDDAQAQQTTYLDGVDARRQKGRDRGLGQQAHGVPLPRVAGACHHIASLLAPFSERLSYGEWLSRRSTSSASSRPRSSTPGPSVASTPSPGSSPATSSTSTQRIASPAGSAPRRTCPANRSSIPSSIRRPGPSMSRAPSRATRWRST